MTSRSIAFVIASQRTGTTALQRALTEAGGCFSFGEVFHGDKDGNPANFFQFLARDSAAAALHRYPSLANRRQLFDRYTRFLLTERLPRDRGAVPLIDVKHNSLHHFDALWHGPFDTPGILALIKRDGHPVLRIRRRNLVAQILSLIKAEQSQRFHFRDADPVETQRLAVRIEPQQLWSRVERAERENAFVDAILADHGPSAGLDYEDLFDADTVAEPAIRTLEGLLGVTLPRPLSVPLRKTSRYVRLEVENRAELLARFDDTRFAASARAALGA